MKMPTLQNTRNEIAKTEKAIAELMRNEPPTFPVEPRVKYNTQLATLKQRLDRLQKLHIILNK